MWYTTSYTRHFYYGCFFQNNLCCTQGFKSFCSLSPIAVLEPRYAKTKLKPERKLNAVRCPAITQLDSVSKLGPGCHRSEKRRARPNSRGPAAAARGVGGGEWGAREGGALLCWTAPGSGAAPAFRTRRRRERRRAEGAPVPRRRSPRGPLPSRELPGFLGAGLPGRGRGAGAALTYGRRDPGRGGAERSQRRLRRLTPRPVPPPQVTPCLLFWSAQPIGRGGWILREPGWARRGGSGTLPYRP